MWCMSHLRELWNILFSWFPRLQATSLARRPQVSLWRHQKIWASIPLWHERCGLGSDLALQLPLGASQLACLTVSAAQLLPRGLGLELTTVQASGVFEPHQCDESWLWAPGQCNSPCWSWCPACRRDLTQVVAPLQGGGPSLPQEVLDSDSRGDKQNCASKSLFVVFFCLSTWPTCVVVLPIAYRCRW